MKMTQFTDYSLRLLLYLAARPGRVCSVREVAEYYAISAEHLKKVVRNLSDLDYVRTVRGKNGGLVLARAPADINLGDVLRRSENLALLPCHEAGDTCPLTMCGLRGLVDHATLAFLAVFDQRSLADIVPMAD